MDDYAELAARVAARVGGMRGCLILSRDGLVLGTYPDSDENVAKPSWLRFALLGEPDRSFVEFADQVWVYVHRGPYAAFAVANAGVRPGLLMDQLEQALLMAEESRSRREGLRAPEVTATPAAGPRTPLHAPTPSDAPVIVPVAARVERPAEPEGSASAQPAPSTEPEPSEPSESTHHEAPKLMTTPATPVRDAHEDADAEVDKVMLAQEFGGLLQEPGSGDEATS